MTDRNDTNHRMPLTSARCDDNGIDVGRWYAVPSVGCDPSEEPGGLSYVTACVDAWRELLRVGGVVACPRSVSYCEVVS